MHFIQKAAGADLRWTVALCISLYCTTASGEVKIRQAEQRSAETIDYLERRGAHFEKAASGTKVFVSPERWFPSRSPWSGTRDDLTRLSKVGAIHELDLSLHMEDPKDLDFLEHIPGLKYLRIFDRAVTHWTSEHFSRISRCRNLERLSIVSLRMSENAIEPLSKLNGLKHLRFVSFELKRSSIDTICQLESLERFTGEILDATDQDLKRFTKLPNLQELYIGGKGITDDGRKWLSDNHPTCKKVRPDR